MDLPGGLLRSDGRRRDVTPRPITGSLELAIAEVAEGGEALPRKVSRALSLFVASLGDELASTDLMSELCVADRQFLMHQLAVQLDRATHWESVVCSACFEAFDLQICLGDLPVKESSAGFPFASVETSLGLLRVRVPNGSDQMEIAGFDNPRQAQLALLRRCVADVEAQDFHALTADDIACVEASLESVSPRVVTQVAAACPSCRLAHVFDVDPYLALGVVPDQVMDDVHTLAAFYHWSESEILAMPRSRRAKYLARVECATGGST